MSWNRVRFASIGSGVVTAMVMYCGSAFGQTATPAAPAQEPANVAAQQPAAVTAQQNATLALPVIAEPQRVRPDDPRPVSINLFGQERDSFDQVAEAQNAGASRTALRNMPAPVRPTNAPLAVADAELLRQVGIVTSSRYPGRPTVERVLPNSAAFAAGVRTGDVVSHIDRTMLAVSNVPGQAVAGATPRVGIDINRNGQMSRLVLNVGEPVVQRALVPAVTEPVVRTGVAPITTPSGRVIEPGPAVPANGPLDHATIARSKVVVPGSGSTTGPGVGGSGDAPQGPGTPGLGSAPAEGGGSAAMRTGRNAPVKPGQGYGTGRLY